ncbi:hypothetical protein DFH08DRAFT_817483 [Mycena albidolilacea]|uniref:Uncharacterized protein n=1 Tax=Mycena albidolilacea TaxID=1033008 RepID=A0AAD6ZIJ5_9AGAR|nr:hypothetical protein DFH08DRAFT_817483 [Mycena albidolilacea]
MPSCNTLGRRLARSFTVSVCSARSPPVDDPEAGLCRLLLGSRGTRGTMEDMRAGVSPRVECTMAPTPGGAADGRRREQPHLPRACDKYYDDDLSASTRHSCTPSAHTGFPANRRSHKPLWARAVLVVYVTPHVHYSPESRRSSTHSSRRPPFPSFSAALDPSSAVIRAGFGWVLRPTGRRAGGRAGDVGIEKDGANMKGIEQGGAEGGWAVADTSEMEIGSLRHTLLSSQPSRGTTGAASLRSVPFSRRPPRVLDSLRCKEDAPGGWPSLQGVDVWDLPALLLRLRVCVDVRSQPRFVARRMRR